MTLARHDTGIAYLQTFPSFYEVYAVSICVFATMPKPKSNMVDVYIQTYNGHGHLLMFITVSTTLRSGQWALH